jgi:hypothetical protein
MPKTPSKMGQLSRSRHAEVSWCAEDIRALRPGWDDKRCNQFLMDNEDDIQCAMIERGWDAISDLLRWGEVTGAE